MLHKSISFILVTFIMMNFSCAQNKSHLLNDQRLENYKKGFEKKFIDHFPSKVSTSSVSCMMYSDKDEKKNDFALILYEYDIAEKEIDSLLNKTKDHIIAKYEPSDSCLLIVNRFETKETLDNPDLRVKIDSSLINRECYAKKYPVPNFTNFEGSLDDSFMIHVLESKKSDSWEKEFGMKPAPQMPNIWKNGFSKGIAVSKKKRILIYWTVIW